MNATLKSVRASMRADTPQRCDVRH